MTRDRSPRLSRRGVLGLAVGVGLAGCNGIRNPLAEPEPTYLDRDALAAITSSSVPRVPETIPAPIAADYLELARRRTQETLSLVPTPLGPDDLPNGAIRDEIARANDAALENLDRASSSPSRFEALRFLRFARGNAADAAATWQAARDERSREDVESGATDVRADLEAFRTRMAYRGDDVERAVIVFAGVEDLLVSGGRDLAQLESRIPSGRVGAPVVGQMAHYVESARAGLADGEHVYDQYRSSVERIRPLGSRIEGASSTLASAVDDRYASVPAERPREPSDLVVGNVSDTPAEWLLQLAIFALYGPRDEIDAHRRAGRHAAAVVTALDALTWIRAFEAVRDVVESGERYRVETAADVRAKRETAIEALRATLESPSSPDLVCALSRDVAGFVRSTDEDLATGPDRANAAEVGEDAVEYVWAAAVARAIPGAVSRVVDVLSGERTGS